MIKVWHNSRCSKSRNALQILQENGVDFEVFEYLKDPPSRNELHQLQNKLAQPIVEMLRTKDKDFPLKANEALNAQKVLDLLSKEIKWLERPIIETEDNAIVGRPLERVEPFLAQIKRKK